LAAATSQHEDTHVAATGVRNAIEGLPEEPQLVRRKNPFPGSLDFTALGAGGGVGLDKLALDGIPKQSR
jgi:hypothetical protein